MPDKVKMVERVRALIEEGISGVEAVIEGARDSGKSDRYVKEIRIEKKYVMVRMQGAVDSATIPIIRKRHKTRKDSFDKHIVVDFKDVKHIDCAALASLVEMFSGLKVHNKKLIIIHATERLVKYTEILGLGSIISILPSEEDAMAYLACV